MYLCNNWQWALRNELPMNAQRVQPDATIETIYRIKIFGIIENVCGDSQQASRSRLGHPMPDAQTNT
jgi:hypothetical protein